MKRHTGGGARGDEPAKKRKQELQPRCANPGGETKLLRQFSVFVIELCCFRLNLENFHPVSVLFGYLYRWVDSAWGYLCYLLFLVFSYSVARHKSTDQQQNREHRSSIHSF